MRNELDRELSTLRAIFDSATRELPTTDGASDDEIQDALDRTGIRLTGDIVDLYKRMNGSSRSKIFAVFSDEAIACEFSSLASALRTWESSSTEFYDDYEQDPPRDPRIDQRLWGSRLWFPFAETNGGGTQIYWDADPSSLGTVGQIIVYQHDPDAIYYVAEDFATFMAMSNKLLQRHKRSLLDGIYE